MDVPRLGYLIDDVYLEHDPGKRHPESPMRLHAIQSALSTYETLASWQHVDPRPARREELELVHRPGLVDRVEKAAHRAPAYLDPDTVVSEKSYRTALAAVGGVLECADAIATGRLARAFAFVRPPGHHAEADKAMGFCLFNNVAVAAAHLRQHHGYERVAIVDIDLHHGNGTQAIFYPDPHVLYLSTHQFPYYPGTGDFDETGSGDGKGYTVNLPLPAGTGDSTVVPLYTRVVVPILEQYRPDAILVSAGFDAYFKDPLGGLGVTAQGYSAVAAALIRAAERITHGRICFVLEGGYSAEGLQSCTKGVMAQLEKPALDEYGATSPQGAPRAAAAGDDALAAEISAAAKRRHTLWKW